MFYEEIFIDGWIHWRSTPGGKWERGTQVEQEAALKQLFKAGIKCALSVVMPLAKNVKSQDYKLGVNDAKRAIAAAVDEPLLLPQTISS